MFQKSKTIKSRERKKIMYKLVGKILDRKLTIPILFFVLLSFAVSSNAQTEYNSGTLVFPDNAVSTPHDPKIACHPNGDHCLLAYYDSYDSKIHLKLSWNKGHHFEGLVFGCTGLDYFLGCSEVATISNSLEASRERLPLIGEYHLPFDVTWVNSQNKYYILIENVDYTYIPYGSFSTLRTNGNQYWGLQFLNDTTYFQINTYQDGATKNRWYLKDITDGSTEDSGLTSTTGGCSGSGGVNYATENFIGFSAINDGTLYYRIWYGYNSQNCSVQMQGTIPEATTTGISYYVDGVIQYSINHNETKEALTSDFSSYSSASTIYSWNESEYINASMSNSISTNQLYAYELNNETGSISGIYIYNEQKYPLNIQMNVQDADRGDVLANFTATIICTASNYTQTDTGSQTEYANLNTPCLTGNDISIQTTEGKPLSFNFSYDVLTGCEGETTFIYTPISSGYVGFYNLTIRVRDSILNTGVSGASVTLSGDTQTTDSNGNAYFEISPIANAYFTTETDAGSCIYKLYIAGDEYEYTILSTRIGYSPYIENGVILGESPFSLISGDFTTVKTIIMDQEGSNAEVHIFSSDGVELFPSVLEIGVYGANHTYANNYGELIESNISYVAPALFRLIDGRETYSANFTLKYYYGDTFDYYEQNETITKNGYKQVNFYINENFANLKCSYDTDCPESVCSGSYYKQFSSCSNGVCTYTSENCVSPDRCDTEKGCFDIQYAQTCDYDQECADSCLTNYSMVDKSCGSDGFCIGKTKQCTTNCSSSDGVCSELLSCLYPETDKFRLVFPTQNNPDSYYQAVRKDITCSFDNIEESFCITQSVELLDSQGIFGTTDNIDTVTATPEDWKFIRNDDNNGWVFYAVSGTCSDTCELSYEFCGNGCNVDTGKCIGETTGQQQVYSDWVSVFFAWLNGLIPFEYRLLIWGVFTMLAMGIYRTSIKGHSGGDKDTMLVGLLMFFGGVGIGWVHWIFLAFMGFVISFVLWEKYIHK